MQTAVPSLPATYCSSVHRSMHPRTAVPSDAAMSAQRTALSWRLDSSNRCLVRFLLAPQRVVLAQRSANSAQVQPLHLSSGPSQQSRQVVCTRQAWLLLVTNHARAGADPRLDPCFNASCARWRARPSARTSRPTKKSALVSLSPSWPPCREKARRAAGGQKQYRLALTHHRA